VDPDLQSLCDLAQQQLQRMDYLACEHTLVRAERLALEHEDFDTIARLYMPLQESRRQRRLVCGEGVVKLDLIAQNADHALDAGQIVARYPHGQLLVAGWGSIEPALRVRELAAQRSLYVETYLAAVYPVGSSRAAVVVPTRDVGLPEPGSIGSIDELLTRVPAPSLVVPENELPVGERRGTTETFAHTMALWERLHAPFLAAADAALEPAQKLAGYRRTIGVDYACELAHQKLSAVARELARARRAGAAVR